MVDRFAYAVMAFIVYVVMAAGLLAILAVPSYGATACYSLREARKAHPGIHLYKRDGCWGLRGRPRKAPEPHQDRRKEDPPPSSPRPATVEPRTMPAIVVIQPWLPVPVTSFAPWDERIEPWLHRRKPQ